MRLFNFTTVSGATYEISIDYGIARTRLLLALTRLGRCLTKSWRALTSILIKRPSASLNASGKVAATNGTPLLKPAPAGSILVTAQGHGAGGAGSAMAGGAGGGGGVVWLTPDPPEPDVKCDVCSGTGIFQNEECWHCFGEGLDPIK